MTSYTTKTSKLSDKMTQLDSQVTLSEEPLAHRNGIVWLIVGAKGKGKTSLLLNALKTKNEDGGYRGFFDNIYICSPTMKGDSKAKKLYNEVNDDGNFYDTVNNNILNEIIEKIDAHNEEHPNDHNLLVLDDCINFLPKSNQKNAVFNSLITNCRHKKLCIFVTLQKLKGANTIVRANTDMVSMFNSTPAERADFCKEFGVPEALFDFCTDSPYSFLHYTNTSGKPLIFKKFNQVDY